jgi:serine protease Do
MRPVWLAMIAALFGFAPETVAAEPTLAEERAFQAAVARVADAVVQIEPLALSTANARGEARPGMGPSTGLVVAPERVITTDFAVPADVDAAVIVLADGGRHVGRVQARDLSRGLVLLAVTGLPQRPPVEPMPRAELAPGQWAIAVGRGWSAAGPSVAVGIVSAVNRVWGKAVQTDAAVSPMNYGGPLVDIAGRVIGLLAPLPADTAGITEGTTLYDAGIGFALPLEELLAVLPRLERGESLAAGILGISYRSQDVINGPPIIAAVRQGSPAARAGLRPGDRLRRIDGLPIQRIADARQAIARRYAGDTITVVIERTAADTSATDDLEIAATLVEKLSPWRRAVIGIVAADESIAGPGGVQVGWVLPDGPADRAGLRPGDTITTLAAAEGSDKWPLESPDAMAGILAGIQPGDQVRLTYQRDGAETTVDLETVGLPAEMPADAPVVAVAAGDPLAAVLDSVEVVRLEAAEVAEPALAVIPRGKEPVDVLIWLSSPHGPVTDAEAATWKRVAAQYGVAIVLPGSADPDAWSRADIPLVLRGLASLAGRRPIEGTRIGVAGSGAGAAFAWLVATQLGDQAGGVALVGSGLPRLADITPATPDKDWWILLGPGRDDDGRSRVEADRQRLSEAGYATGLLPDEATDGPPTELLCRWVSLLGIL